MKRQILEILIFAFLSIGISSKEASSYTKLTGEEISVLIPSEKRFVQSLAGTWEVSYNEKDWSETQVPFTSFENRKIYLRRFVKINPELLKNLEWHFYFLGIDQRIEVHINDQFVGNYIGTMTPFEVRIPKRMLSGETNLIKLVISPPENASKKIRTQNPLAKRISTGVLRELFLIGTNQVWVSDVDMKIDLSEDLRSAELSGKISVSSGDPSIIADKNYYGDSVDIESSNFMLRYLIRKKSNGMPLYESSMTSIKLDAERIIEKDIELSLSGFELWELNDPNLYELVVEITKNESLVDNYKIDIGFRKLKFAKIDGINTVIINNRPERLNGISYIEDKAEKNFTLGSQDLLEDIENISTLGANLIRVKADPPHPLLPHYCNKYGLLFTAELPLYDVPSELIELDEIRVLMKNIAKRIVNAYGNNPSLAAWGISEGLCEEEQSNINYQNEIVELFKSISNKPIFKIVPFSSNVINDDKFDLIGIDIPMTGVNLNTIAPKIQEKLQLTKKPAFLSFGTLIQPNNHNGYSDPNSIEYQAYYILNLYKISLDKGGIGSIIYNFNDYALESPILMSGKDDLYTANNGLLDRRRNQRLSYSTIRALFKNEKEPLLNAGSFSETTPVTFIIFGVVLGIIVLLMLNRFKRFREYLFRSLLRPYNFYADIRDQRIMSSLQTVLLGIVIAIGIGMYLASILYFYRSSFEAQYIIMHLMPYKPIQEFLFNIINIPELLMLVFSVLSFLIAFLIAFLLRMIAFFARARIFMNDCMTIAYWSGAPMLFLILIDIVLIRVLVLQPESTSIFLLFLLLVSIWTILRLLKSISVVFDKRPRKVYFIGFVTISILLAAIVGFYQFNYSIFAYGKYFVKVILNS